MNSSSVRKSGSSAVGNVNGRLGIEPYKSQSPNKYNSQPDQLQSSIDKWKAEAVDCDVNVN